MDFSGRTGRVIDNPVEAQSAALEEGHTWRVRRHVTYWALGLFVVQDNCSVRYERGSSSENRRVFHKVSIFDAVFGYCIGVLMTSTQEGHDTW